MRLKSVSRSPCCLDRHHATRIGSGMSLAGSGDSTSASSAGREGELSDRRERMRAAALRRAESAASSTSNSVAGGGSMGLKSS